MLQPLIIILDVGIDVLFMVDNSTPVCGRLRILCARNAGSQCWQRLGHRKSLAASLAAGPTARDSEGQERAASPTNPRDTLIAESPRLGEIYIQSIGPFKCKPRLDSLEPLSGLSKVSPMRTQAVHAFVFIGYGYLVQEHKSTPTRHADTSLCLSRYTGSSTAAFDHASLSSRRHEG